MEVWAMLMLMWMWSGLVDAKEEHRFGLFLLYNLQERDEDVVLGISRNWNSVSL